MKPETTNDLLGTIDEALHWSCDPLCVRARAAFDTFVDKYNEIAEELNAGI